MADLDKAYAEHTARQAIFAIAITACLYTLAGWLVEANLIRILNGGQEMGLIIAPDDLAYMNPILIPIPGLVACIAPSMLIRRNTFVQAFIILAGITAGTIALEYILKFVHLSSGPDGPDYSPTLYGIGDSIIAVTFIGGRSVVRWLVRLVWRGR